METGLEVGHIASVEFERTNSPLAIQYVQCHRYRSVVADLLLQKPVILILGLIGLGLKDKICFLGPRDLEGVNRMLTNITG